MATTAKPASRDQYLQMLGIVQYVPRELADTQQSDTIQHSGNIEKGGDKPVVSATGQAVEIADKLPGTQTGVAAVSRSEVEEAAAQAVSDSVELSFALWQPADDLLICTAVDDHLPDQQEVSLLANIVKAMGQAISPLPQFELINWPPHRNIQGGEAEAREYLSTLIKARVDSRSTKTLLLLGKTAGEWLLAPEQIASVEEGRLPVTENLTALLVPTLQDMLADQAFKRVAWEIISRHLKMQREHQQL